MGFEDLGFGAWDLGLRGLGFYSFGFWVVSKGLFWGMYSIRSISYMGSTLGPPILEIPSYE